MTCPRCGGPLDADLYGPCDGCVADLRAWGADVGARARATSAHVLADRVRDAMDEIPERLAVRR